MIQCPHSIFFFRNSVEDFSILDEFKGYKHSTELLSDELLRQENERDYYKSLDAYKTNGLYTCGKNKQIEIGDYVGVVRVKSGDNYIYRYKVMGDNIINTLRDWAIVPLGRPVVNPPEQKLHVIDIPGANGILDLSNSLTKYPVFNNRTGSWAFAILNEDTDTPNAYNKVLNFLQGTDVKVVLEDDRRFYYKGRVYVENVNAKADGTPTEFSLGYDLEPYRLSVDLSTDDWLWDPFNFETDSITQSVFKDIPVYQGGDWYEYDFSEYLDKMPVTPTFIVNMPVKGEVYAQLYNSDLDIKWKQHELKNSSNYFYDYVLSALTKESVVKMRFKYIPEVPIRVPDGGEPVDWYTKVTVKFRSGRL